ncbi:RNA-binding protein NOB1 [Rhynchophorus ferrugineus]|uniref:RNA-binding protein NOB1 n=1 Tax=Rhynchophorus ferrugineus TaxID=354439 RepID=A0A834IM05_RHYFE|nr:hypothetical protein GWI33_000527 [Rhynchophorus ferrugineus]
MSDNNQKQVEYLVVDTTAFIQNAPLHDVAEHIITCQDVVEEVTNKRQLRRLVALPYNLIVKDVFPEYVKLVTEFSKKTGDYPSLSATDIKVMALTYQLEKDKNGIKHLKNEPTLQRALITTESISKELNPDITGFFLPKSKQVNDSVESFVNIKGKLNEQNILYTDLNKTVLDNLELNNDRNMSINTLEYIKDDILPVNKTNEKTNEALDDLAVDIKNLTCQVNSDKESESVLVSVSDSEDSSDGSSDDDDERGWIKPTNISLAKKQVNSQLIEEKHVEVACMTTDFAMQNVLKQINLNVCALDGRIIKQLRTYILRCYACFKTTSIMTKRFCPKCGNNTLKKVAVSVNEYGDMQIHINPRKPLTGRGKKFSLPKIKGGKHPNNPIIVEDQPIADNRPSRLARTKNNPLDDDYIAGFSPFVMRDVNSKSAQLHIKPGSEFKQWMKRNPNESRRKKK